MTKLSLRRHIAAFFFLLTVMVIAAPEYAQALDDPNINATAAILLDPSSGMVLYDKNAGEKRFPASTTKIMTALVVLEHTQDLNEIVTVTEEDFIGVGADSSKAGFKVGEQVPVIDLLYGLMLPSGNEAANTLARHVGGSIEGFVGMMNARAKELGCTGTHFVNPNGLHDENHYTTARDLSTIAAKAMEDETFALIANTAQKTLSENNLTAERGAPLKVFTTNMLIFSRNDPLYYSYAKGIKTGSTSQAGYCLVSTATKKNSTLISVVLGCERPPNTTRQTVTFTETKRLFEWGFENFASQTLVEEGEAVTEIDIRLSTDCDRIVLQTASSLDAVVPIDIVMEDVTRTMNLPDDLVAPIQAGDVIGTMDVSYNGVEYGSVELVAIRDVSLSQVLYYADKLENFFKSSLFKRIVLTLVVVLAVYFLYVVLIGRRRKRRRKDMMRSKSTRYRRYK